MRKKTILYSPILLLIVFTIVVFSNPLRWPVERIRANILKRTSIGMEMEDVINLIESNEMWKIDYISNEFGYNLRMGRPEEYSPNFTTSGNVIGKHSIRVHLGEYKAFFITDVIAFFGFDENSRLVNLHVRKDIDAL